MTCAIERNHRYMLVHLTVRHNSLGVHVGFFRSTKLPASLYSLALRPFFLYLVVNMPGLNNKVSAQKFSKKLKKFLENQCECNGKLFLKHQLSEINEKMCKISVKIGNKMCLNEKNFWYIENVNANTRVLCTVDTNVLGCGAIEMHTSQIVYG